MVSLPPELPAMEMVMHFAEYTIEDYDSMLPDAIVQHLSVHEQRSKNARAIIIGDVVTTHGDIPLGKIHVNRLFVS